MRTYGGRGEPGLQHTRMTRCRTEQPRAELVSGSCGLCLVAVVGPEEVNRDSGRDQK
jgi:hypothetical protein